MTQSNREKYYPPKYFFGLCIGLSVPLTEWLILSVRLPMRRLNGITIYKAERGYLPNNFDQVYDCDIIFTVVTRLEVQQLRKAVRRIDEKAFLFTNTIKETVRRNTGKPSRKCMFPGSIKSITLLTFSSFGAAVQQYCWW